MELVFENGWNGNGWMVDRLASFRQAADAATDPNTRARADVVEDKDAYHFYVEMPGQGRLDRRAGGGRSVDN
jgi:HSP20 family molecular chaperone IbpA